MSKPSITFGDSNTGMYTNKISGISMGTSIGTGVIDVVKLETAMRRRNALWYRTYMLQLDKKPRLHAVGDLSRLARDLYPYAATDQYRAHLLGMQLDEARLQYPRSAIIQEIKAIWGTGVTLCNTIWMRMRILALRIRGWFTS